MRLRIVHQTAARKDLRDIWWYGFEVWGEQAANDYLHKIRDKLALIADNPQIGARHMGRRKGYRRLLVGEHIIFYKVEAEAIRIFRFLHTKMDQEDRLK
jgi:toxin ParE1/3/4